MPPKEIGAVELHFANHREIAWRHIWLTNAMIAGKPIPERIRRPRVVRRMSLAQRLDKLRRFRATLEPP
jgi:hypothetical protein